MMARRDAGYKTKKLMNYCLENGAYSNKNLKIQMSKGASSYNPAEKVLVKSVSTFRKWEGKMIQVELKQYLTANKDFLAYFKNENEELYNEFKDLIIDEVKEIQTEEVDVLEIMVKKRHEKEDEYEECINEYKERINKNMS